MVKVSVITVTYNCKNSVEKTIESILNQDYSNLELVVVDGASVDGTQDVISRYKNRISKFVSEKDKGIFDAMNKGVKMASGDWVIFMNAGDQFADNSVLSNLSFLLNDPVNDVVYGAWQLKYRNTIRESKAHPFFAQKGIYKTMGFSHQSSLVRRTLAEKHPFQIEYRLSADYKMMWMLYHSLHAKFVSVDFPIAVMEDKAGFTVSNYKKHLIEECNVCGFANSLKRKLFVEKKYIVYKVKRLVKSIILR